MGLVEGVAPPEVAAQLAVQGARLVAGPPVGDEQQVDRRQTVHRLVSIAPGPLSLVHAIALSPRSGRGG